MAIPTSANIELSDVIAEIGSGDSLADCFANANAAGFNPTYEGNKDRLSNFRGYTHVTVTLTAFDMSPNGFATASDSCTIFDEYTTFYHDGTGAYPSHLDGDSVYVNSTGTPFTGSNQYYLMGNNATVKINNQGLIIGRQLCI